MGEYSLRLVFNGGLRRTINSYDTEPSQSEMEEFISRYIGYRSEEFVGRVSGFELLRGMKITKIENIVY